MRFVLIEKADDSAKEHLIVFGIASKDSDKYRKFLLFILNYQVS